MKTLSGYRKGDQFFSHIWEKTDPVMRGAFWGKEAKEATLKKRLIITKRP